MNKMPSSQSELWSFCVEYLSTPCTLVLGAVTASVLLLWGTKAEVPVLVCANGFRKFLHIHCPVVLEHFHPTPWCWGGRLQTLIRVFIQSSPAVKYRNELIRTDDGGQLSLDWVDNSNSAKYPKSLFRPTVLILPGLTGNSQQTYVLHMIRQATRHGYRCVVMNNRGFGGEDLLTPRTFCAANTSDLDTVISHVKELYPEAPLLGAGVSLGGMLLLNYLADKGPDSKLIAGLTLSVIWNTFTSCESLEQPINKLIFNRHLSNNLCNAVHRQRKILGKVIDVDHVLKARTIREFDERFTSVIFGYKSCTDYYQDASPGYKLPQIAVPVLCLNSSDDPFSPKDAFPLADAQRLPNVALLLTSHGGHIGFLEGLFPHGESYMNRVFNQFVQAAFENLEDLKKVCRISDH